MNTPTTYIGCRTAPKELTTLMNHEFVASAANDSDAYRAEVRVSADVVPIDRLH